MIDIPEIQLAEDFAPTSLDWWRDGGFLSYEGIPRLNDLYFISYQIRHLNPRIIQTPSHFRLEWLNASNDDDFHAFWYIPDYHTSPYRWTIREHDGDLTRS